MTTKYKIARKIRRMPLGMTGVALGITGIANAWTTFFDSELTHNIISLKKGSNSLNILSNIGFSFQVITAIIALFFIVLLSVRWIMNRKTFINEAKDPLASSYMPTILMASTGVAFVIGLITQKITGSGPGSHEHPIVNVGTIIASIITLIAVLLHLAFLIFFYIKIIGRHNFKNDAIYVSWLVPTCGISVACGFEPGLGFLLPSWFFQFFWWLSFTNLIVFYLYMVYKHFFFHRLKAVQLQSMGIFFAAPFLALNGFITMTGTISYYPEEFKFIIIFIILVFCMFGTLAYYPIVVRSFINRFNPGFAALTFPAAISALATVKLTNLFYEYGLTSLNSTLLTSLYSFFGVLAVWFLITGTLIITYVLIKYFILMAKELKREVFVSNNK